MTVQIHVDDQPYAMTGPDSQTVGELANEICAGAGTDEARFVVGLRCNGKPVPQQELASVLQTSASHFDHLEMQTQPVSTLVRSTLDQAIGVLEDSARARQEAADLLASGQNEPAMRELQKFLDAWKQIHQTLMVTTSVLHVDLDNVAVGATRLTDVLESLRIQFTELRGAMSQGDFVVVGDVLRYELTEPLSQLVSCLRQIRDQQ
jgi:hypothetical protein